MIYSIGYGVNANGEIIYHCHADSHQEENDPNKVLLDCYIALPVNSLVRKSIYDQVGEFEETYRAAQDHDMLIRVAEITKLPYIQDFFWYYRRHASSISSTHQEVRWTVVFEIIDNTVKRYPYKSKTVSKRKAVLHYRLGVCLLDKKNTLKLLLSLALLFYMTHFVRLKSFLVLANNNNFLGYI